MKVVTVNALPNYQLNISFSDGIAGKLDLKALVQKVIFTVLQNEKLFAEVNFNQSAIFWNDDLEIDLINVYLELSGKSFDDVLPKVIYALN